MSVLNLSKQSLYRLEMMKALLSKGDAFMSSDQYALLKKHVEQCSNILFELDQKDINNALDEEK